MSFICCKAGVNARNMTRILGKSRLTGCIDPSWPKNLSMILCFKSFLYSLRYFAALDNHILSRIRLFCCLGFPSQYLELEKVMEFTSHFPIKKNEPQNQNLFLLLHGDLGQIGEKMILEKGKTSKEKNAGKQTN